MAASFVKKSNGQFYLRLTGNTNTVNFAGTFEAGNWYYLYIDRPAGDGGTITLGKEARAQDYALFASTNANPIPPGALLWGDSKFVGCFDLVYEEQIVGFDDNGPIYQSVLVSVTVANYTFSGSGLREYLVTGNNQNGTPYDANATYGGLMCLGGASLNWGVDLYAYPGSGYISNPVALGIKDAGAWKNSYNMFIRKTDQASLSYFIRYFNGNLHFYTSNPSEEFISVNGYVVEFGNYFSVYPSQVVNTVSLYRAFNRTTGTHLYTTSVVELNNLSSSWTIEGTVGYVYNYAAVSTYPVYRAHNPVNNDYLLTTSYIEVTQSVSIGWNYEGILCYCPVVGTGGWRECLTGWIKVAGTWRKFYQNYGNSSWINMLELSDDAIDFAIQVIAIN